ncbi:MAG: Ankyrin repeat (3 copies) [Rickettsiales bacterium]|jgi:hypothetical protein|nr:Ankyrin repeat (3 copies) [Rickettsiales bacterium]
MSKKKKVRQVNEALWDAAFQGNLQEVKDLIENKKANVDAIVTTGTFLGCTSLHLAAMSGKVSVFQYLIGKIEPDTLKIQATWDTWNNATPLHIATKSGYADIVFVALNYAKEKVPSLPGLCDGNGKTAIKLAKEQKEEITRQYNVAEDNLKNYDMQTYYKDRSVVVPDGMVRLYEVTRCISLIEEFFKPRPSSQPLLSPEALKQVQKENSTASNDRLTTSHSYVEKKKFTSELRKSSQGSGILPRNKSISWEESVTAITPPGSPSSPSHSRSSESSSPSSAGQRKF